MIGRPSLWSSLRRAAHPGRRGRAIAIGVAVAAACVPLLYLAAAAILLADGRLGRLLSSHPDKVRLSYARASSVWFGRVHFESLDLRGRDAKTEWQLHVDAADARISLFALLAHRLHVISVDAQGVIFHIRLRRDPAALTPDVMARLAPIEGFPDPPLLGDPPEERKGQPLTVAIDGIDARDVREVWIDTFRLTGTLAVHGAFSIAPGGHFEVSPAHVEVREASLSTGGDPIVTGVRGAIDARIEPTSGAEGSAGILRAASNRASLEGQLGGAAFLRHFLPEGVAVSGGAGTFHGTMTIEHGVARKDSAAHLELSTTEVAFEGGRAEARPAIDLTISEDDGGSAANVTTSLADVALFVGEGRAPSVKSAAVELRAHLDDADLAGRPRDFTYEWSAPKVAIVDLRVFDGALGRERAFRIDGGAATVTTAGSGSLRGLEAHAGVEGAWAVTLDGAAATSRLAGKLALKASFVPSPSLDLSGSTLALEGLAVTASPAPAGWIGRVELERAVIHVSPPSFDATFATSARDARPLLSLYAKMSGASAPVRAALAIVPDAALESMTANLAGSGRLHVDAGRLSLHALDLRGAGSRARFELTREGKATTGGLLIEAGPAAIGVAFEGSGSRLVLGGLEPWFAGVTRHP